MFRLGRKILFLALLLVMPLQGITASLSHLLCAPSSGMTHMDAGHHHDDGGNTLHPQDGKSGATDHAGHLSCHQSPSGMPSIVVHALAGDLAIYNPSSFTSPDLFFPEQPQRPPRT
ncbi:MAG TPA: hypothetical protein VLT92_10215 [Burkholderiales bacterium]|nr:hypothetical protein [Burkholderiales bacterium]